MRVWFLSPEVSPHSQVGGLADVVGALPAALEKLGCRVRVITPYYDHLELDQTELEGPLPGLTQSLLGPAGEISWEVFQWDHIWFLAARDLFSTGQVYGDLASDPGRFCAFTQAAIGLVDLVSDPPDLLHAHDWTTGLASWWARESQPLLPTCFTIHNIGYQGVTLPVGLSFLEPDLPTVHGPPVGHHNLAAIGALYATEITTVSPTHAAEVQSPLGGHGLESMLSTRSGNLSGIINGIDENEWNPATDPHLLQNYDLTSLDAKQTNKKALLEELGLTYREGMPVVGMISRLVEQKGIELLGPVLTHFLESWQLAVVILGSGERGYEQDLERLAATYPEKMRFICGYDQGLSHRIEAGADIFLMPSLYEPCGLNQMYSQLYGTAPVVRKVGGLADTVTHFDPVSGQGTGFVFEHYNATGLGWALGEALSVHMDPPSWRKLQTNMMELDYGWDEPARQYLEVYQRALSARSP